MPNQTLAIALSLTALAACAGDAAEDKTGPGDPDTADQVPVDRFSMAAGHLMVRDDQNGLPGADQPIDFDSGEPFITRGLSPQGSSVRYYNLDVQPATAAPIYALERPDGSAVEGQLNIVDVVPGDVGYNDFWQVIHVAVPADYVANDATSVADLEAAGYAMTASDAVVNCPIVPVGSTATMRLAGESPELFRGWYRGQVVHYFTFGEAALRLTAGSVPTSPIFVTFNVNPDQAGGGPGSGFRLEPGTDQTHNVTGSLPGDGSYSPLWSVNVYDNADFDAVADYASAAAASVLASGVALVNCPVVERD